MRPKKELKVGPFTKGCEKKNSTEPLLPQKYLTVCRYTDIVFYISFFLFCFFFLFFFVKFGEHLKIARKSPQKLLREIFLKVT